MISVGMTDRGWLGLGARGKRQLERRQDACFLGEAGGRSQVEEQGPKSTLASGPHPQGKRDRGKRALRAPEATASTPPRSSGSLTLV